MTELTVKLRPRSFKELIPIVALYRPGPLGSGMVDDYVNRKHGVTKVEYLLPELEALTAETLGVIVYQDQVLQIANRLAGYSLGEADLLRRAMGKKKPEEMEKQRERFVGGCVERGIDRKQADAVFQLMAEFAGYGFAKSHSAAYALITYQTAYLKANHPREYLAALLTTEAGNHDKLARYIAHAQQLGIEVLAPDVNESARDFTVVAGGHPLRTGGREERGRGGDRGDPRGARAGAARFASLFDFAARVDGRRVNRRVVESLVKCGSFDSLHANRAAVWAALDTALEAGAAAQRDREIGQTSLFGAGSARVPEPALPEAPPWTDRQRLEHEKEVLGFYVTGHPLASVAAQARPLRRHPLHRDRRQGRPRGARGRNPHRPARDANAARPADGLRHARGSGGQLRPGDLRRALRAAREPAQDRRRRGGRRGPVPLLVSGTLEVGDTPKILVRDVTPLERAEEKLAAQLRLRVLASEATRDRMLALRDLLGRHPGDCAVALHLVIPDESETVLALPGLRGVRPDEALLREIDGLFGRRVTEIAT